MEAVGVEAEGVEDGGLEIADIDGVLGDGVAEVVGGAVVEAGLHAAAGHPDGEAVGVVVAAEEFRAVARLVHRGATELSTPDDECLIE